MESNLPIPDPTLLTTAQLDRSIESLEARIDTRIDAMDKASRLLHEDFTRVPTEMDRRLGHLQELIFSKLDAIARVTEQQFNAIGMRFEEMDKRTAQLSVADKTAIAAALQAQKEAANLGTTVFFIPRISATKAPQSGPPPPAASRLKSLTSKPFLVDISAIPSAILLLTMVKIFWAA